MKAGQFHREEHFLHAAVHRRRSRWRESYRDAIAISRPARFDFLRLGLGRSGIVAGGLPFGLAFAVTIPAHWIAQHGLG